MTYDKNGNIGTLNRYAYVSGTKQLIDMLNYTYTGNQVIKIDDASAYSGTAGFINGASTASEYGYDVNGNMNRDDNNKINITYNLLNLPQTVNSSTGTNMATYIYDATGRKLKKTTPGGSTYYMGGLQFDGTVLSFMATPEGRVYNNNGSFNYEYFHKDHLGNVRMSFDNTGTGNTAAPIQIDDYFPFGYRQPSQSYVKSDVNKYLYNGKEIQYETGWYDYGARGYDPICGCFHSIDPLAEKNSRVSPYVYVENNPIRMIDPDGREGIKYTDEDGNKTIESNIVVLLEQRKEIPKDATEKQKAKIEKHNNRIGRMNADRINSVSERLNEAYNGNDGKGTKNSAGETVKFKFNIIGLETPDTDGGSLTNIRKIATDNGLKTSKKYPLGNSGIALAAVVTTRSARGTSGLSNGIFTAESANSPRIGLAHEIGHTFQLDDNFPQSTGGLMDYPPGGLINSEVDEIWNKAYDK